MPTFPLPERANVEQLRKRAKDLKRAVRSQIPRALALVEEHAPHRQDQLASFSLDSAQLVIARMHGFPSWPGLRRHLEAAGTASGTPAVLTIENRYRLRRHWAAPEDVRRCAAAATGAHSDPEDWRPLLSAQHNAVTVIAFATPAGPVFAELTPTRVALSAPQIVSPAPARATVAFHTPFGTIAGVASPEVSRLSVERLADRRAKEPAIVTDGVFAVPNAFLVDSPGLVLRVDGADVGDIVPEMALPPRSASVVDRSEPVAVRHSPAEQAFADHLAATGTPPVVDPERWVHGVSAALTATEHLWLGRCDRLLTWYLRHDGVLAHPFVFDFEPQWGPVRDHAVHGATIAATRLYYDFVDGSSGRVAVVGLHDDRVASIRLRRDGEPDMAARIAGGTFLIAGPDLTSLPEEGRVTAALTTLDATGHVMETLPYQR